MQLLQQQKLIERNSSQISMCLCWWMQCSNFQHLAIHCTRRFLHSSSGHLNSEIVLRVWTDFYDSLSFLSYVVSLSMYIVEPCKLCNQPYLRTCKSTCHKIGMHNTRSLERGSAEWLYVAVEARVKSRFRHAEPFAPFSPAYCQVHGNKRRPRVKGGGRNSSSE